MINLSTPNFNGNEVKYLKKCIETGWVSTSGPFINRFEKKISKYTSSKYAIGVINATSALDISLKLLGIKPFDEVIVPTLTFISPVNAILYNNARPIFMDCDNFCNIDVNKIIKFIKEQTFFKNGFSYNKKTKRKIAAIIIVHVWGNAVFLDELIKICKDANIKLLEDASESLGTFYTKGKFKGRHSGTIGDIGCISFNANKVITSGGGGVILTKNKKIANMANYIITQSKDDPLKYIHNNIGYNLRLTNVHAAIGLAQIENIKKILIKKNKINKFYKKHLSKINNLELLNSPDYSKNNNWLNLVKVKKFTNSKNLSECIKFLHKNKINVRPIWHLNHLQKYLNKFQKYEIINAPKIVKNSFCLPSSSQLSDNELKYVAKILRSI